MDILPPELFLPIITYLDVKDIISLRSTSRLLYTIASNNELWRQLCFDQSSLERNRARQASNFHPSLPFQAHPQVQAFRDRTQAALLAHQAWVDAQATEIEDTTANEADNEDAVTRDSSHPIHAISLAHQERGRRLANWDPTYREERVDWLTEYAARHAQISRSWFQPALAPHVSSDGTAIEVRGLALLGSRHIVAPMDDDSLAIWNCDQTDSQQAGRLVQKSHSGLLQAGQNGFVSVGPTLASAISVDSMRSKAYVVVQNYLQEVDLDAMQISSSQRFPSKIAALSDCTDGVPLTIGTRSAVHLYDPRLRLSMNDEADCLDQMSSYPNIITKGGNMALLKSGNFDRFASLHQAGPTAIQHLSGNDANAATGDIVVSGRFPSLLVYDRRKFPKLKTTLYSGAQLCGLATLPYAYSSVDTEIMLQGELPIEDAQYARSRPGHTLIACGEYNGRGALEIYGLSAEHGEYLPTSTFKNRVSTARAKVLSIANHGTKLVMSDAEGGIRWLEHDGQSLIRRWNINDFVARPDEGGHSVLEVGSDEAVLKLLPLSCGSSSKICEDGVLAWTGERIALLSFSPLPKFGADGWEEELANVEEAIKRREERIYGETMRRALERQADEVRWMSGLGLNA